jgi:hypothetical protein
LKRGALAVSLYDLVTGDEDARVCKDIPDAACNDQPENFFLQLGANVCTKIGDELASAKLVLPWLLSAAGAPAFFIGLLVPIRESLSLLPQLFVAAAIRARAVRKWFWVGGSIVQGLCVMAMAAAALLLEGAAAGWTVVGLLVIFSLARGVSSVSAKDVMGKTVSKTRRGTLTGYATAAAGLVTIAAGGWLQLRGGEPGHAGGVAGLLLVAGGLWLLGAALYANLREQPGATEGAATLGATPWPACPCWRPTRRSAVSSSRARCSWRPRCWCRSTPPWRARPRTGDWAGSARCWSPPASHRRSARASGEGWRIAPAATCCGSRRRSPAC